MRNSRLASVRQETQLEMTSIVKNGNTKSSNRILLTRITRTARRHGAKILRRTGPAPAAGLVPIDIAVGQRLPQFGDARVGNLGAAELECFQIC